MAPQQSGLPGVVRLKITAGVVAACGDDGVGFLVAVVELDGNVGVDGAQLLNDILHQHGVFGRRLDDAPMAAGDDAQQVEEPYQRDISGHDDEHAARRGGGNGIGGEPRFERFALEHPAGDGRCGTADFLGRKPPVRPAGAVDNALCLCCVAEIAEPFAQNGKKSDSKDSASRGQKQACLLLPRRRLCSVKIVQAESSRKFICRQLRRRLSKPSAAMIKCKRVCFTVLHLGVSCRGRRHFCNDYEKTNVVLPGFCRGEKTCMKKNDHGKNLRRIVQTPPQLL